MLPLSNIHSHTTFSDGRDTAEDMVRAALALGFHTLGFSDHGCAGYDGSAMPPVAEPTYRAEVRRLREAYAGRIAILLGYEHDWFSPFEPDDYDYWIESVHYLRVGGEYLPVDWTRELQLGAARRHFGGDMLAFCRAYFRTVCESIQATDAPILGHIELVMKFNERRDLFDDADPRYLSAALEAAQLAVERDKLVEINTGAIARGYRTQPYPGEAMLRYLAARRARVILSSDCHDALSLDCAFPRAAALARACGFRTAWAYRGERLEEYVL